MSTSHKKYQIELPDVIGMKKDSKFFINLRVHRYDRHLKKNIIRWINVPRIFLVTSRKGKKNGRKN